MHADIAHGMHIALLPVLLLLTWQRVLQYLYTSTIAEVWYVVSQTSQHCPQLLVAESRSCHLYPGIVHARQQDIDTPVASGLPQQVCSALNRLPECASVA
jgi:hypothetical protein